jgi:hypothetical protein
MQTSLASATGVSPWVSTYTKSCTYILRLLTEPPEDTSDPRRQHRHHLAVPEEKHAGAKTQRDALCTAAELPYDHSAAADSRRAPSHSRPHAGRDGLLLFAHGIRIDGRNFEDGVAHPLR